MTGRWPRRHRSCRCLQGGAKGCRPPHHHRTNRAYECRFCFGSIRSCLTRTKMGTCTASTHHSMLTCGDSMLPLLCHAEHSDTSSIKPVLTNKLCASDVESINECQFLEL